MKNIKRIILVKFVLLTIGLNAQNHEAALAIFNDEYCIERLSFVKKELELYKIDSTMPPSLQKRYSKLNKMKTDMHISNILHDNVDTRKIILDTNDPIIGKILIKDKNHVRKLYEYISTNHESKAFGSIVLLYFLFDKEPSNNYLNLVLEMYNYMKDQAPKKPYGQNEVLDYLLKDFAGDSRLVLVEELKEYLLEEGYLEE